MYSNEITGEVSLGNNPVRILHTRSPFYYDGIVKFKLLTMKV